MKLFTTILFYASIAFHTPSIALALLFDRVATFLLKSSINKVGFYYYGYRSKIALKLKKHAYKIIQDVAIGSVAFGANIEEKEAKEKVMKAIRADKPYDYVLKAERKPTVKPEDRTTFNMKYLDPWEAAKLGDNIFSVKGAGSGREEKILSGTQQFEILKICLCGWENMEDPDSPGGENKKLITFDNSRREDMIAMLPPNVRSELADFARGEAEVTEGEEQS